MAKILIQYPPEYACYEKFARKLGKICQNLEVEAVYFVSDPTALIERWLQERAAVEAKQIESDSVPVGEITHAVTFESADGLFAPINVEDVPSRTIVVPITRVANKDRGEEFDVYIGRGTKWGNPYAVGFGQAPGQEADINPCKSARMLIYSVENVAGAGKLEEAADQILLLLE